MTHSPSLSLVAAALAVIATAVLPASAARPAPKSVPKAKAISAPPGWTLTFDDEFNKPTLDTAKWAATDGPSVINNEWEDYAPDDVALHDGMLRLTTRKRARDGREYTSGEVRTVGKFSQLYGRFEFRARLPRTTGTWSAEYLIAENEHWPPEIDVEEYLGKDPYVLHMTTHWATQGGHHGVFHNTRGDTDVDYTQWHVYTVEWDPGQVRWLIDGKQYAISDQHARPFIAHVPMYVRINTALGGWAGGPDDTSVWPQYHDIDWVRIYRRTAMPPPVNAGPDQELASPHTTAQLAGISCSPMGPHIATWSQIAGAGQVSFAQPHALATAAKFSLPGTYRLRLTVADGSASAYNDITVLVNDPQNVSLPVAADAYMFVNSTHSGLHVDGTAPDLLVGERPSVEDTHDRLQSYLTFDLAHVPHVSHAVLRLYGGQLYTSYLKPLSCIVRTVPDPHWDEKAHDWTDAPVLGTQAAALDVLPFMHNSIDKWYDIDVTQAVQDAQASGKVLTGFCILPASPDDHDSATFHSAADAAHAPHLVITP